MSDNEPAEIEALARAQRRLKRMRTAITPAALQREGWEKRGRTFWHTIDSEPIGLDYLAGVRGFSVGGTWINAPRLDTLADLDDLIRLLVTGTRDDEDVLASAYQVRSPGTTDYADVIFPAVLKPRRRVIAFATFVEGSQRDLELAPTAVWALDSHSGAVELTDEEEDQLAIEAVRVWLKPGSRRRSSSR